MERLDILREEDDVAVQRGVLLLSLDEGARDLLEFVEASYRLDIVEGLLDAAQMALVLLNELSLLVVAAYELLQPLL